MQSPTGPFTDIKAKLGFVHFPIVHRRLAMHGCAGGGGSFGDWVFEEKKRLRMATETKGRRGD